MSAEQGQSVGNKVGSAIGGAFQALQGAGDAIRGTVNEGLDSAGEAAMNRDKATVPERTEDNTSVAAKGKADLQAGISKLSGASSAPTASSTGVGAQNPIAARQAPSA